MKPYKCTDEDLAQVRYPVLATPKIDGIRCVKLNGKALTASLKPVPNLYIRGLIERSSLPNGFDGELVTPGTFQETTSAVMSELGTPTFTWRVFDWYAHIDYEHRIKELNMWFEANKCGFAEPVLPDLVINEIRLLDFEEECLRQDYEGLCFRQPLGVYKCGRSTLKEGGLLALKRFIDSEAIIIGWAEQLHNNNPAFTGELGQTKRSKAMVGLLGTGVLGAFKVRDIKTNIEFEVGTGFLRGQRMSYWEQRDLLVNRIIKYKSFPHGTLDKPRHPVFLGFRDPTDMTS